jgi:hypothetical protein
MRYPFIVARWESGYLRFFDNTLIYKDLSSGNYSVLRTVRNNNKDYDCFQLLSSSGVGRFRFLNIVFREIIADGRLEYIELSTPNNEIGVTMSSEFSNSRPPLSVFREYIDQTIPILAEAETIANNNNVGFPASTDICNMLARYKDSNGYFWWPVLNWNSTKAQTIQDILELLEGFLLNGKSVGNFTNIETEELLNYARSVWQQ